ncbi:hypothetical protein LMF89_14250 [Pelosinus sp. Bkl1]|uniref:Uncharacterized protein n=1 Tax=Pelosinus baikalensis TaxID=2892015 RepID=A0ABS8HX08_9FIRM|nr:hypothetical protein [Pelosinus baikalensis]
MKQWGNLTEEIANLSGRAEESFSREFRGDAFSQRNMMEDMTVHNAWCTFPADLRKREGAWFAGEYVNALAKQVLCPKMYNEKNEWGLTEFNDENRGKFPKADDTECVLQTYYMTAVSWLKE